MTGTPDNSEPAAATPVTDVLKTNWCVYIIEADDGSLYTGITNNLARRWQQHLSQKAGAKFFRGRKPRDLKFVEQALDRSRASQREAAIKKLSRQQKLQLISSQATLPSLASVEV